LIDIVIKEGAGQAGTQRTSTGFHDRNRRQGFGPLARRDNASRASFLRRDHHKRTPAEQTQAADHIAGSPALALALGGGAIS